jgi:hypothetical protein
MIPRDALAGGHNEVVFYVHFLSRSNFGHAV